MNEMQQGLIALMKSAVLQQPQPLPEGFDLQAVLPLIMRHHIAALTFDGAARCGISHQDPAMVTLFQVYYKFLRVSEGQIRKVGRLFQAFEENGIDYMPLKGCNMKAFYPTPEMRTMGDADILIRLEQYSRIVPVMESLGFEFQYESDHELVWKSKDLNVELHKRLIPSNNRDMYAYFGDGWQLAVPSGGSRWDMTPEDAFVFLFAHFAKHYRDGGIGCRYVLDLWVYLRANPELRMDRVMASLEELKLDRFYRNISRLMAVWFEGEQSDDLSEYLTEFIFSSGSWGSMEQRALARGIQYMHQSDGTVAGKLRYLMGVAFPACDMLKEKYTVLKKAPWLLPAVWVVRIVHKLIFKPYALLFHKTVVDVTNLESVESRQQMLRYVGLDHCQEP